MGAPGAGELQGSPAGAVDLEEIGVNTPNTTAKPATIACAKRPRLLD
jgi:hypothetical protein